MSKTTTIDDDEIDTLTCDEWQARMSEFSNMAIDASERGESGRAEYFWGIAATAMRAAAILERRAAREDGTKPILRRPPHEEIEIEKLSVPQGELRVRRELDPKRRLGGSLNDMDLLNDSSGWLVLANVADHVLEIKLLADEQPWQAAARFCPESASEPSGIQRDIMVQKAAEKILREQSRKIRWLTFS